MSLTWQGEIKRYLRIYAAGREVPETLYLELSRLNLAPGNDDPLAMAVLSRLADAATNMVLEMLPHARARVTTLLASNVDTAFRDIAHAVTKTSPEKLRPSITVRNYLLSLLSATRTWQFEGGRERRPAKLKTSLGIALWTAIYHEYRETHGAAKAELALTQALKGLTRQ